MKRQASSSAFFINDRTWKIRENISDKQKWSIFKTAKWILFCEYMHIDCDDRKRNRIIFLSFNKVIKMSFLEIWSKIQIKLL